MAEQSSESDRVSLARSVATGAEGLGINLLAAWLSGGLTLTASMVCGIVGLVLGSAGLKGLLDRGDAKQKEALLQLVERTRKAGVADAKAIGELLAKMGVKDRQDAKQILGELNHLAALARSARQDHATFAEEQAKQTELIQQLEQLVRQRLPDTKPQIIDAATALVAVSALHRIPQRRNPNFTGREGELDAIAAALASGSAAAITQAIHGLGGVGKTQLASEYAYRHAAEYKVVWWIPAERPDSATAAFSALAAAMGLNLAPDAKTPEIVEAVHAELERRQPSLFIFDSAESVKSVVPYLPRCGHALITSRNPNWRAIQAKDISLDVWPPEKAAEFLINRTGLHDPEAAAKLAEDLGCLPLALEHAGAFIEQSGCTIAEYREMFRQNHRGLLETAEEPMDYQATIATTWTISVNRVRETKPAAVDLLKLLAFFAPDDIPLSLLAEQAGKLPEPLSVVAADPMGLNDAIAALRGYSLIQREDDTLSIHRLVQLVIREGMEEAERKEWAGAAVRAVNGAFPGNSDDVRFWPVCQALAGHARAAAEHAEGLGIELEATAWVLALLGNYLYGKASYAEAESLMRRTLAIDETRLEPEHPDVGSALNNLAHLLQATSRLSEAEPLMRRALAISEKKFGLDHPIVAAALNNLAHLLQATNRLSEAEPLMRRALQIDEKKFGPEHPGLARDLNNLAPLLRATSRLSEAEPLMQRALKIAEKSLGPEHPTVAVALNNLASLLQDANRLTEAEPLMRRALQIDEKSFGPEHPNVAIRLNNLAGLLHETNRLSEAEPLMRRAWAIDEKSFGPEHPNVAAGLNNLASLLQATNRLSEAEPLMRRALHIDEKQFGPEHPDVAIDLHNLAALLYATNRMSEAEPLMRRALIIFRRFGQSTGHRHPHIRAAIGNYVGLLLAMGLTEEQAKAKLREVREGRAGESGG